MPYPHHLHLPALVPRGEGSHVLDGLKMVRHVDSNGGHVTKHLMHVGREEEL